ncbi:uncharacterized protein LOC110023362 [Phalaenopsis equestris]|uniref:uncharacterized protein LOC110023362 n=1 Tax=Phalaenopsis equestris TaxID=78828 RepID=UPI0009E327F3|nr:uncharacterized protein LOC110023362 [Phalaenopsis equestris]
MDYKPYVPAVPPESCAPPTFSYQPPPPGVAIDPAPPPSIGEEAHAAEFMVAGMSAEDAALWRRGLVWDRGMSPFRGWYGMRWGVGYPGNFSQQPYLVDTGAVHGHGSDIQHGKSTIVEPYKPELLPQINPLKTTGEEAALELPASEPCLPAQSSLLPLTWCDICRVDCNSLKVLEKHKTGKRHKRTLLLLENLNGLPEMVQELAAYNHTKPEHHSESVSARIEGTKVETPTDTTSNIKKKRKRNAAPEQPRVCVLCNATCNSEAMFESHLAGKKHLSRINHFQRPDTIFGLMTDYMPPDQSSTSASQDTQTLYYGLMNCGQPQAYAVLNPHLDSESQYGFIQS